jgi:hypothetical protein
MAISGRRQGTLFPHFNFYIRVIGDGSGESWRESTLHMCIIGDIPSLGFRRC